MIPPAVRHDSTDTYIFPVSVLRMGWGSGGKGKALRITFYIQNNTRALLGRQWGINAGHLRDDYAESIGTLSLGGSTARRVPPLPRARPCTVSTACLSLYRRRRTTGTAPVSASLAWSPVIVRSISMPAQRLTALAAGGRVHSLHIHATSPVCVASWSINATYRVSLTLRGCGQRQCVAVGCSLHEKLAPVPGSGSWRE